MSDQFENPVDASEEAAAAASIENEVVETEVVDGELVAPEVPVEEEEHDDEDFFAESEAEAAPEDDPTKVVTLLPTSGKATYVPVEGPMAMVDLIAKSALQFAGDFQCFLNGAQIDMTTTVPGGATVTIIGKVKGG